MDTSFHVQWHITSLCPIRCQHCYQDDFSDEKDLDTRGLLAVSKNLVSAMERLGRKISVNVTGGEPLLRSDLLSLLQNLDREPWIEEIGLITNGLFVNREIVKRLSSISKLGKVKVSLDGYDSHTNDSIRSRGGFETAKRALELFGEEGRFDRIVMFTALKRNYRDLLPLVDLCQKMGFEGLMVERFVPLGRGYGLRAEVLGKEEWRHLLKMLASLVGIDLEETPMHGLQAFQLLFRDGETELQGAYCIVGSDGVCVMPDGTVFPCRRLPLSIGNLLERPFENIWENSELLNMLRSRHMLKGRCAVCDFENCRGCRSLALALTGDPLSEDPHCSYQPSKLSQARS